MSTKRKELRSILFEFPLGDEESIGLVSTCNVVLRHGERIPRVEKTSSLGRYVEIGDEVECKVTPNSPEFGKSVYVEEDESRIRPEWTAEKAYLLSPARKRHRNTNETPEPSDLRTLLQCRKKSKEGGTTLKQVPMEEEEGIPGGGEELHRARLSIIKSPVEITDLSYYLHKGDEFSVEINDLMGSLTIKRAWYNGIGGGENRTLREEILESPRTPGKCNAMRSWLLSRGLSFNDFKDWINGKTPIKLYFPFMSTCYSGVLERIVKEESHLGDGGMYEGEIAVFEKSDFYIEGVRVGKSADLRLLLRPGNRVNIQVLEMTNGDKKHYKYMTIEKDIFLCGQLCYIGESAPKDPKKSPNESKELNSYLRNIGLTLNEFYNNRDGCTSTVAPKIKDPQLIPLPQWLLRLFNRSMAPSTSSKHSQTTSPWKSTPESCLPFPNHPHGSHAASDLLQGPEDISNAMTLSKTFTQALLKKIGSKMHGKMVAKYGAMVGPSLKEQESQLEALSNSSKLMKKVQMEILLDSQKEKTIVTPPPSVPKGPKRDMKKILESYAASSSSKTGGGGGNNESSSKRLNPLETLLDYIKRNKTIALRSGELHFGSSSFPLSSKTTFAKGHSLSQPLKHFYTLHELYFFWKNKTNSAYKRLAYKEGIEAVAEEDRIVLIDFFSGKNPRPPHIQEYVCPSGDGEGSSIAKRIKIAPLESAAVASVAPGFRNASPKTSGWKTTFSQSTLSFPSGDNRPDAVGFKSSFSYEVKKKPSIAGFATAFDSQPSERSSIFGDLSD
ncbi:Parafibrominlike [Caligus rogercresseyi]|uniref:Parafibrominlike n=1 Tax=Caligus rogercresseyi TaxID=217165 RepID=A0A7T8JWY5_CALRO|nr:Parafibrominlike [Caligus rogercresseyi]